MISLEMAQFRLQAIFSAAVIAFCMFQLAQPGKKSNESLYSSILSGILGYWLPSPANRKQSNVAIDSQTTNVVANNDET